MLEKRNYVAMLSIGVALVLGQNQLAFSQSATGTNTGSTNSTAINASTNTNSATAVLKSSAETRVEKLINDASAKILKRLGGKVPDDLKQRVEKEISARVPADLEQKLKDELNNRIPDHIRNKLPSGILGSVKTARFENINYWEGYMDPAHQMTIYVPQVSGSAKLPLILYVHGGGWTAGRDQKPKWVSTFNKNGYAVALINYRLAQEGPYPAQIQDLYAGLKFIKKNIERLNVDPTRIGVWGASAGGHLAALMGTAANDPKVDPQSFGGSPDRSVKAVCDWCGPTDLVSLGTESNPRLKLDWTLPTSGLSLLLGGTAQARLVEARAASPLTYVNSGDPPFLIMHGTADDIVPFSQSQVFADALKKAGVDTTFVSLDRAGHAFENRKNLDTVIAFFNKHLK